MNNTLQTNNYGLTWFIILITFIMFNFVPLIGYEVVIFATLTILTFFAMIIEFRGRILVRWTVYHSYLLLFVFFIYLSSRWALRPEYTVGRGNTMLITSLVMVVISVYFIDIVSVDPLLKIAMWGGYVVSIIGIIYYGPKNIILFINEGVRLTITESFININDLGMCATYAIIINIYYIFNKQNGWYTIFSIPALLITFASGSRKAFVILVVGVIALSILKNYKTKNIAKRTIKIIASIISLLLILLFISKLSVFEPLMERMQFVVNGILTGQNSDYSTLTRLNLITIGQQIFQQHPVLGIGINNSQFIVEGIYHRENYYLHNNYIELLADGGIVGFVIYYWIFLYLFISLIKNRDFADLEFDICLLLLIIHLLMDIGSVSFLNRTTYFYLLIFCKELKKITLKKKM